MCAGGLPRKPPSRPERRGTAYWFPTNVAVPLSSSAPGPASPAVVSMMLDPVAASQNVAASTLLAAVADGVWLGTQLGVGGVAAPVRTMGLLPLAGEVGKHGVVPSLAQQS